MLSKEMLLKNALTYTKLGDYDDAKKCYKEVTTTYPDDYRGWWGLYAIDYIAYCEGAASFPTFNDDAWISRQRALKNARTLHDISTESVQLWRQIVQTFNKQKRSARTVLISNDEEFLNRLKLEHEILLEIRRVSQIFYKKEEAEAENQFWTNICSGQQIISENEFYHGRYSDIYLSLWEITGRVRKSPVFISDMELNKIRAIFFDTWKNKWSELTLNSIFHGSELGLRFDVANIHHHHHLERLFCKYGVSVLPGDRFMWCLGRSIVVNNEYRNGACVLISKEIIDSDTIRKWGF